MYLSIGWSRLMKCDRDIWKIYFACQKCLQNLAIKFSGNLVDFSKCDPYLIPNVFYSLKRWSHFCIISDALALMFIALVSKLSAFLSLSV